MDPFLSTSSQSSIDDVDMCLEDDDPIGSPPPDIREVVSVAAQDVPSGSQPVASTKTATDSPPVETMAPRAYQLEMLHYSLQKNSIVAMDTGSGKTHVAVLRIKSELERCHPEQMIWFLAPTISLCTQQFDYLKAQIPLVPMKALTGNENVDTWAAKTWSIVLKDVRIVVSTYKVLLDALDHAYVKMEHLALIVIDEAHNCVGASPCSRIMTTHYHPSKHAAKSVPAILGLTASPVIRSRVDQLEALETLLDAQCATPTIHRGELLKCVKRPRLSYAVYEKGDTPGFTPAMLSLRNVYSNLDIADDPYVRKLIAEGSDRTRRELARAVSKNDTYIQKQLLGLYNRSTTICEEIGSWAADYYISKAISESQARTNSEPNFEDRWAIEEKAYLARLMKQIDTTSRKIYPQNPEEVSNKVKVLLRELLSAKGNIVGIIFVRERASVTILSELLSYFPLVQQKYRIGTMVGTSSCSGRTKNIFEFNSKTDIQSLDRFRSGKINLLIATSVLEEGIDVPACNLVICFDKPANLKVFIQRRGRARMRDSALVLIQQKNDMATLQWQKLEEDMKRQYEDDERELRELENLEESEAASSMVFFVESTGARLSFDNAQQHLEHFCRVVSGKFVDGRPDYIFHVDYAQEIPMRRATVLLPSSLIPKLRRAESASAWRTEKNAKKDVAFQAYVALYKAGLVNDNLMPFTQDIPGVEDRQPEIEVDALYDPWPQIAQLWQVSGDRWLYSVTLHDGHGTELGAYNIMFPTELPQIYPTKIFLDHGTKWELRFGHGQILSYEESLGLPDHTSTLIAMHFCHRFNVKERHHVIKVSSPGDALSIDGIGSVEFNPDMMTVDSQAYLIRDRAKVPFLYRGILPSKPEEDQVQKRFFGYEDAPKDVPYLSVTKWTKRSDFLHPISSDAGNTGPLQNKAYSHVFPMGWATIDAIPVKHAQFGMLIPSIIHLFEVMLIARELTTSLMAQVGLSDIHVVREATSARSANESVDYERLEFLGDSILKYLVCVQSSADNLEWPEGYLSFFKDKLVSNSRLSRAALETGLARFIVSKSFTGQKWRPLCIDDYANEKPSQTTERRLSTKTLADVVEALIGASFAEGGTKMALQCLKRFLEEVPWRETQFSRDMLYNSVLPNVPLPPILGPLETLIGYSFQKKALLMEAMTHGSYIATTEHRSYERLEFLGDAVMDKVVVSHMFDAQPPLPNGRLHMLKSAMVNGDFLAFVVMEYGIRQTETFVAEGGSIGEKEINYPLWKFMRYAAPTIGLEQVTLEERHQKIRGKVLEVLEHGDYYPWALLASLKARKYYSDIFEALIGAVWIDSGSLDTCKSVMNRFGIMPYMERILREDIHVQHPKEELTKLAVSQTVVYEVDARNGGLDEKEYTCKIRIGDCVVADVDGGVDREEVKIKAAEVAVRLMRGNFETSK